LCTKKPYFANNKKLLFQTSKNFLAFIVSVVLVAILSIVSMTCFEMHVSFFSSRVLLQLEERLQKLQEKLILGNYFFHFQGFIGLMKRMFFFIGAKSVALLRCSLVD